MPTTSVYWLNYILGPPALIPNPLLNNLQYCTTSHLSSIVKSEASEAEQVVTMRSILLGDDDLLVGSMKQIYWDFFTVFLKYFPI